MITLKDKITTKNEIKKMPANEVLKLYKEVTNKFDNLGYFFDTITLWDLTHRNNTYTSIKISSELRKSYLTIVKRIYIPSLFPDPIYYQALAYINYRRKYLWMLNIMMDFRYFRKK